MVLYLLMQTKLVVDIYLL